MMMHDCCSFMCHHCTEIELQVASSQLYKSVLQVVYKQNQTVYIYQECVTICYSAASNQQANILVLAALQVCSQSSLTKAITIVEDTHNPQLAPAVLNGLLACTSIEDHIRDALRFRLNLAAGQLSDAARDALDIAKFEQVSYTAAHKS